MEYLKRIVNQNMEEMLKMDGIGMIRGSHCRYMEMMEMLKGTIYSEEGFL